MARTGWAPRIRWTADEAGLVLRRAYELRALDPHRSLHSIVKDAQAVLPVARRRPVYPPLVSWTNKRLQTMPPPPPLPQPSPVAAARAEGASLLVAAGVALVVGILRDPAVRAAAAGLLARSRRGVAASRQP